MLTLGILVSHRGSNFQAIIDGCENGRIDAKIAVTISNNSQSEGLKRAHRASIKAVHLSQQTHPEAKDLDSAMLKSFLDNQVDLIVTAGYMKKLGPKTLAHFSGKILNVHPSLLPKYGGKGMYGMHVHRAVIAAGDTESGITIHWLDGNYDTGPIISQKVISMATDETAESLAEKMLPHEHELLVATLADLSANHFFANHGKTL